MSTDFDFFLTGFRALKKVKMNDLVESFLVDDNLPNKRRKVRHFQVLDQFQLVLGAEIE